MPLALSREPSDDPPPTLKTPANTASSSGVTTSIAGVPTNHGTAPRNVMSSAAVASSNVTASSTLASSTDKSVAPPNPNVAAATTNAPRAATDAMGAAASAPSQHPTSEVVRSPTEKRVTPPNPNITTSNTNNSTTSTTNTSRTTVTAPPTVTASEAVPATVEKGVTPSNNDVATATTNEPVPSANPVDTTMSAATSAPARIITTQMIISNWSQVPTATTSNTAATDATANVPSVPSEGDPIRVWNGELILTGKERGGTLRECYAEAYRVVGRPFMSGACHWPKRLEIRFSYIQPGQSAMTAMAGMRVQWAIRIGSGSPETLYRLGALAQRLYTESNAIIIPIPGGGRLFLFGHSVNAAIHTLVGAFEPKPDVPRMRPVRVWRGFITLLGFSRAPRIIEARAFRTPPSKTPTRTVGLKWPRIELDRDLLVPRTAVEDYLNSPYAQWFVRFSPMTNFSETEEWWRAIFHMHLNNLVLEVNVPNTNYSVILIPHQVDNHGLSLCGVYAPRSNRTIPSIHIV